MRTTGARSQALFCPTRRNTSVILQTQSMTSLSLSLSVSRPPPVSLASVRRCYISAREGRTNVGGRKEKKVAEKAKSLTRASPRRPGEPEIPQACVARAKPPFKILPRRRDSDAGRTRNQRFSRLVCPRSLYSPRAYSLIHDVPDWLTVSSSRDTLLSPSPPLPLSLCSFALPFTW